MKIVLSLSHRDSAFDRMAEVLGHHAEVEVAPLSGYSLKGADILIGKALEEKDLLSADRLKAVFAYKTGVDDFPLSLLKKKGIILVNSHVESDQIAQYAFVLASTLASHILPRDKDLRERGLWFSEHYHDWESIYDKKVGLLGYGHIGRSLQILLKMNGIPTCTLLRSGHYEGIETYATLEELIAHCDVLISSLPDTPETRGLLNAKIFAQMKAKYLVDVGRSSDIVLPDLYHALLTRQLAGAAIDGWDSTPDNREVAAYPYDHEKWPFDHLDNIILSPHCATQIADGHAHYVEDATANVLAYLAGQPIANLVDLRKGY
jgi:phosphoglycerate dehydrogenase-like enzyme